MTAGCQLRRGADAKADWNALMARIRAIIDAGNGGTMEAFLAALEAETEPDVIGQAATCITAPNRRLLAKVRASRLRKEK